MLAGFTTSLKGGWMFFEVAGIGKLWATRVRKIFHEATAFLFSCTRDRDANTKNRLVRCLLREYFIVRTSILDIFRKTYLFLTERFSSDWKNSVSLNYFQHTSSKLLRVSC